MSTVNMEKTRELSSRLESVWYHSRVKQNDVNWVNLTCRQT